MRFIDEAIIEVTAGHGGAGAISFRREIFIPRGGPDGGPGGRGGSVIFQATHNMSTLLDFRYRTHIKAEEGQNGMPAQCDGKAGEDLIVPVPVGTVVYDVETGEVIVDFVSDGQTHVVAKGGRGGKGNMFFVTSTRQAPKFAQPGEEGEHRTVRLELKLLADVGLIGLPNAGKSTFLSVVSDARPKIADYPFTTLTPGLGVVKHKNAQPFVVADLPGLIEGAHEGKGMGDKFLKHAERTRLILHLVSLSPDEVEEPWQRYEVIENEMKKYFSAEKPRLILLTKTDLVDGGFVKVVQQEFIERTKVPVLPISSVAHQGIDQVLEAVIGGLSHS